MSCHSFFVFRRTPVSCLVIILCCALHYLLHSGLVHAETKELSESVSERDKILVTGSAHRSSVKDLPASVSVLSTEEIQSGGSDFLQNQVLALPNLNFAGGTARPRFFQVRGIGELEQYEGAPNSSVALIVDDVDLTGVAAATTLFDVRQVELHRGPQPVRFGSSALAGALNIVTDTPTEFLSGNALLSLGNDELVSGGGAISGPLTESASLRVVAFGHRQDGFRDNRFFESEDTNEREEFTGRVKAHLITSDTSRFTLTLTNVKLDNGYDAFSIFNGFHTQSDRPGRDAELLQLAALQGEIDISKSDKLLLTTSYYGTQNDYSFDGDWGSNSFWAPFDPYDFFSESRRQRNVFAQQARFTGSLGSENSQGQYLLGAFYQRLGEDSFIRELADNVPYESLDSEYVSHTFALFSGLDLPLSEDFRLQLGGRLEQRDTRYTDNQIERISPEDLMWGGNASLQYQSFDSFTPYLAASRGFKGGGFNVGTRIPEGRREYDPESLINLELGTRLHGLGGELQGMVSAFINFRRDQQLKLALQDDPTDPLSFTYLSDNAARGRSVGLESEIAYQVIDPLYLRLNGALLDTEVTSVSDESLLALEGRAFSHAPGWQYFSEAEYSFSNSAALRLGVSGRDSFYFDDSHNEQSGVYNLYHAALRYDVSSSLSVELWGRNLGDKRYAVRGFYFGLEPPDFPARQYVQLGDPRTFGVTMNYRFG